MLYLVHMAVVVVFNLEAAFKVQRGWYLNDVLGLSRYDEGDAARPEGYVDGEPGWLMLLGLAWTSCQCLGTLWTEAHQLHSRGPRAYFGDFWTWFDLQYMAGQALINVLFCVRDQVPGWLVVEEHVNATTSASARRSLWDATEEASWAPPLDGMPSAPLHERLLKAGSGGSMADVSANSGEDGIEVTRANGLFVYLQSAVCLGICIRVLHPSFGDDHVRQAHGAAVIKA